MVNSIFKFFRSLLNKKNNNTNSQNLKKNNVGSKQKLNNSMTESDKSKVSVNDWFSDRYQSLIVQRNIAIFLLILSIIGICVSSLSLAIIMKHKTIEPFVIEIERRTGIVTHLKNDDKVQEYTHSIAIRDYFIKRLLEIQ